MYTKDAACISILMAYQWLILVDRHSFTDYCILELFDISYPNPYAKERKKEELT